MARRRTPGPDQGRGSLERFTEIARRVAAAPSVQDAARLALAGLRGACGGTCGYVARLLDDGRNSLVLHAEPGVPECRHDLSAPMPVRGLRGRAVGRGRATVENSFASSRWANLLPDDHIPLANVLFVPFFSGARAQGVVGVGNKPGGFDAADVERAERFAGLVGIALAGVLDRDDLARQRQLVREKDTAIEQLAERIVEQRRKARDDAASHLEVNLLPFLARLRTRRQVDPSEIAVMDRVVRDVARSLRRGGIGVEPDLRPREVEIYRLVRAGLSSKEIGGLLGLAPRTVETHRYNIRQKLGMRGRPDALGELVSRK